MFDYSIYEKAGGSVLILTWVFSAMIAMATRQKAMKAWGWQRTMVVFLFSFPLMMIITARMVFGDDFIRTDEATEQIIKDIS